MEALIGLFDPNDQDEYPSTDRDRNGNKFKCKNYTTMELGDDVVKNGNGHCYNKRMTLDSDKISLPECLPPEAAEGNIEYKLKLVNPSKSRFEHLVTQMKWRLREGQGEAIYEIGVEDGGLLVGLSPREMEASMRTLYLMAEKLGATLTVLRQRTISQNGELKKVAEVLVRKVPDDQQTIELRAAVLGNLDVGKSTLLGVLTQGEPDNGHGSARLNLFRHLHEIQSGRTSSISREILGFDSRGCPVTYNICRTSEEICETASKLITFIDLAGHAKYLRTTVFGLTGHSPHFAMLVVSAISGIVGTTREHLGLAMALDVPVVVVVNKLDLAGRHALDKTLEQLKTLLKGPGCKKVPLTIESKDDALTAASLLLSDSIAPIFLVSCVTGEGLNLLYTFLHVLPPGLSTKEREKKLQRPVEFQVDETFRIPDVGDVVGGLLVGGVIREGDHLLAGPTESGTFRPVSILSLHRHKVACRVVRACESASINISLSNGNYRGRRKTQQRGMDEEDSSSSSSSGDDVEPPFYLRRGMVLVSASEPLPPVCLYFQARIRVLFHATIILPGFQATVHIGNVRQTATVIGVMGGQGVATNETASVMFKFMRHPECIHPGTQLLFREGNSKGIGQVTQVFRVDDGTSVGVQPAK